MPQYETIPSTFEARQVDEHNVREVAHWAKADLDLHGVAVLISGADGEQRAGFGDYIVATPDGRFIALPCEAFERDHRLVDGDLAEIGENCANPYLSDEDREAIEGAEVEAEAE